MTTILRTSELKTGASRLAPSELIRRKALNEISAYWGTRERSNWARRLKRLTADAVHEYEDRFLIELIQNGYDAHPPSTRDGMVHVLLDRDAGNGVLYVANGGHPFTGSNFVAVCEIAQSDKVPGEGIGNKGVGFKSVLQVCAWPEIYSAAEGGAARDAFDGFCFGFAQPDDVLGLVEGDAEKARAVNAEVSPYFLPVPLADQPQVVREFAASGLATVVRLPLKSAEALAAVEQQIRLLCAETAPVLLFLERLGSLVIETRGGATEPTRVALTRCARPVESLPASDGAVFEDVDLGAQGRYFVAKRRVNSARLRATLEESVKSERLDESWLEWRDDAWVSVAVRQDAPDQTARLYTFLPMGEAAGSPFTGHLNAPFYTKLARTSISAAVPLNATLLDEAARLCAQTVLLLRRADAPFGVGAVLDLLTWQEPHVHRLVDAFEAMGCPLSSADVIPLEALPSGRTWGTLDEVYRWKAEGLRMLTVRNFARVLGLALVSESLGEQRINRLATFHEVVQGAPIDPSLETVAGWAEQLAAGMVKHKSGSDLWDQFYNDLPRVFASAPTRLEGRRLLLDNLGQLQPCGGRTAAPGEKAPVAMFFPRYGTNGARVGDRIPTSARGGRG